MNYLESKDEHSNEITTISLKRSAGWSPSNLYNTILKHYYDHYCLVVKTNVNLSTIINSTSMKCPSIVKKLSYDKSPIV